MEKYVEPAVASFLEASLAARVQYVAPVSLFLGLSCSVRGSVRGNATKFQKVGSIGLAEFFLRLRTFCRTGWQVLTLRSCLV